MNPEEEHLTHFDDTSDVVETPSKRSFMRKARMAGAFALVLVIGFAGGVTASGASTSHVFANIPLIGDGLNSTPDQGADLTDFWKAWNVLNSRFVQTHASTTPPTLQDRIYGAMSGLASSYGDPYTVFMPPEKAKSFQEDIQGNFGGVGMEIGLNKDGILTVIAPLKGTPAEAAGIRAGDLVLKIDGKSTDGLAVDTAVKMIRGPKGTVVTVTIYRDSKLQDIKITRATIDSPVLDKSYDPKTGVYTIALYTFTANSGELFDKALVDFRASGSKKMLIDLRGDPGGYLDAAASIASHFLPKDSVIVTEDYKGKQPNLVHRSSGSGGVPEGTTVVILIDQGSASASEILSGALQDNKIATLVGTRSFGKGSVQELINIGGGSLKVTVARWLTPSGRSISDGGLTPDIKAARTQDDYTAGKDPQKDRALEFFATGK
jgi:carboxyl-terminal processing protease